MFIQSIRGSDVGPRSGYLLKTQVLANSWTLVESCHFMIKMSRSISLSAIYSLLTLFFLKYLKKHRKVFICDPDIAQYSGGIMTRLTWSIYSLSSNEIFKNRILG